MLKEVLTFFLEIVLKRKEKLEAESTRQLNSSEDLVRVLQRYLQDRIVYRKHTHFRHEFKLGDSGQQQNPDRSAVVKHLLSMWDSLASNRLEQFLSDLSPGNNIRLSSHVGSVEGLHKVLDLLDNYADLKIVDQLESEFGVLPDVVASYRNSELQDIDQTLRELSGNG